MMKNPNSIKSIWVALAVAVLLEPTIRRTQLVIQPFDNSGQLRIAHTGKSRFFATNKNLTTAISSPETNRLNAAANHAKLVAAIMEIFKLSRNDMRWFEAHFQLRSLELLYPRSVSMIRQLKRCVLGLKFRLNPARSAAIKLELDNQVRARFDEQARAVVCNHPLRPVAPGSMPTEKYIANLVRSNPNFIKFYPHLSRQFTTTSVQIDTNTGSLTPTTTTSRVNTYVYARLSTSSDLLAFTNRTRHSHRTAHNSALERILRKHFARMHEALTSLRRSGFAYTDFKPENVLVDARANRAYLIDLESVVSVRGTRFVCVRTLLYSPPLFSPTDGRLIDVDGLSAHSIKSFFGGRLLADPFDRILSWTFCFSLYILMCQRPAELANYARLAFIHERFKYWVSDVYPFVSYFGCKTGPLSTSLTDMLNKCLVRKHSQLIFPTLIRHAWFTTMTTRTTTTIISSTTTTTLTRINPSPHTI